MAGVVRNPDVADPVDSRVRPGVKHRVIKDAIDGDGGAYSKRERQDRGEGESQVAKDLSKGKAEIPQQYRHRSLQGKGEAIRSLGAEHVTATLRSSRSSRQNPSM